MINGEQINEIEYLKSLWAPKIRRKTKLIVPEVTYAKLDGSLNNDHWAYRVPYAFRDALDIKYEQRIRDKQPYMVWTQGPILSFKEGDILFNKEEFKSVQVQSSNAMGWDSAKDLMYEGNVVYEAYELRDGAYKFIHSKCCTQMQFLEMLIYGKNVC